MSLTQHSILTDRTSFKVARKILRLWGMAIVAVGAFLFLGAALAANGTQPDARARYQQERAACMKIEAKQDRAACLREAGAALQAARRGELAKSEADYEANALMRCNALPQEDRQACERRVRGEGRIVGSVEGGGIYREVTTVEVIPQEGAMPESGRRSMQRMPAGTMPPCTTQPCPMQPRVMQPSGSVR